MGAAFQQLVNVDTRHERVGAVVHLQAGKPVGHCPEFYCQLQSILVSEVLLHAPATNGLDQHIKSRCSQLLLVTGYRTQRHVAPHQVVEFRVPGNKADVVPAMGDDTRCVMFGMSPCYLAGRFAERQESEVGNRQ